MRDVGLQGHDRKLGGRSLHAKDLRLRAPPPAGRLAHAASLNSASAGAAHRKRIETACHNAAPPTAANTRKPVRYEPVAPRSTPNSEGSKKPPRPPAAPTIPVINGIRSANRN